jgi:hypothetical protein
MDLKRQLPGRQAVNLLGLGILVLLAIGVFYLSRDLPVPTESDETGPSLVSPLDRSSPLSAAASSPISPRTSSPLPSPLAVPGSALQPPPSVSDSPLPPTASVILPHPDAVPSADIQLTVLHTNDTWGYLMPCG